MTNRTTIVSGGPPTGADPPGPPTGSVLVCSDCPDGHGRPLKRTIRIINPLGVHHRVADRFSRAARNYQCEVTVWNGENRADGKSLIDLILLVVMPESEVVLELLGDDAATALDPLTEILGAADGEDYTI